MDSNAISLKVIRFMEACSYFNTDVWNLKGGMTYLGERLSSNMPAAFGKLGSTENQALRAYLRTKNLPDRELSTLKYRTVLCSHSGIFPIDYDYFAEYCEYMIGNVLPEMTAMSVWFVHGESSLVKRFCQCRLLSFDCLDVYKASNLFTWKGILEGKRILVVHPFEKSILHQLNKRKTLGCLATPVLPLNCEISVLRMPQLPKLVPPTESDWHKRLERLENEMTQHDFDIAVIGAGAYSLPLAVHAKKLGKKGVHLGGNLQLWFGIMGGRWDDYEYIKQYQNEHWIRPLPEDTPLHSKGIEDGCYW